MGRTVVRAGTALLAVSLALVGVGCGSSDDSASTSSGSATAAASTQAAGNTAAADDGKVYKVVLSNNFLGNDFRPQMIRLAQLTADKPPFAGKIDLQIENSEPTTQAQVASLNNIIQSKPDAILVDAGSGTALNPAIQRACSAGITVVSFDNPVTAPCAYKVAQDMGAGQVVVGQWMNQALGGSGKIFVDRGLPGAPVSKIIQDGFMKGLGVEGDVQVAGEYDGKYAPGPEQQGISQLLVGNKDVGGVMTQGYCSPVFKAFKQAGISTVPAATCYGYNGELVACVQAKAPCAVLTGSPVVVQIAMELALKALTGDKPDTADVVPVPMKLYVTNADEFTPTENPANVEIEQIKLGENAYPDLPPGLALPFSKDEYGITPEQAAGK
jgi:ribose transport system substrate-binding protein